VVFDWHTLPAAFDQARLCRAAGLGLWVVDQTKGLDEKNVAEFSYNNNGAGFTLEYGNAGDADYDFLAVLGPSDSGKNGWPFLVQASACYCCKLCKAQPSGNVSNTVGGSS
jgi:hypothetical protein